MATTNPSAVRAFYTGSQDLYTITYPFLDFSEHGIAGISQASTAVVTTQKKLPSNIFTNTQVLIDGVEGMAQIKTAGENGTNQYSISILDSTSFELSGVDSTGFSYAYPNTGYFRAFTVPQYESAGTSVNVLFDATTNGTGNSIDVNLNTGVITLAGGPNTYQLSGTANVSSAGATYQWYDLTNDVAFGPVVAVGNPVNALFKNDNDADVALKVTSAAGTSFQYPAQITHAQAIVNVISGFVA